MVFDIISSHPFAPTIAKDVIPTPRLLDEGSRHTVEAYEEHPAGKYRAVWRVRDDSYDQPGTKYRLVRVVSRP